MGRLVIATVPENKLRLVVGLGNPGASYRKTRHNVGFMAVDSIAQQFGIALDREKFGVVFGRGSVERVTVVLAKPVAFMNRSGPPVQQLAHYYRIPCEDMLVIHDDIDLAFGKLKIKKKGGHGGHNGVRSLMDAFGGGDFVRLRIGVGRSEAGISVTDHVLGKFSAEQAKILDRIISSARDAVVTVLCEGTQVGMNVFNRKDLLITG
jgi:PTH1 family peptidyl-tRNA hydrolase